MSKRASKKVGSVNPCNTMALYNDKGEQIGYCLHTPNNFAVACIINKNVSYGKAYYELFGETIRKRTDVQDTITVYETLLSRNNTIIKNEINEHKSHIKFS